jgi:hypothetical protein
MTHEMSSIGSGLAWPSLSISSTGESITFSTAVTRATRSRFSPIRYLESLSDEIVSAEVFEKAVDDFVDSVIKRLVSRRIKGTELYELRQIVASERSNEKKARLRKLEALLGYDADEAPTGDIKILQDRSSRIGARAVEEIAPVASPQRPKPRTIPGLFAALDVGASTGADVGAVPGADAMRAKYFASVRSGDRPWSRGVTAAVLVRRDWALQAQPLPTAAFADRLGVRDDLFARAPSIRESSVGLAVRTRNDGLRIAFRNDVPKGRRFELARMIGDHVFVATEDSWRPITAMRTERQQFQRAFAAELLCPSAALTERFGDRGPEAESEVEVVAEEFEVDTDVIFRQIENRRRIEEVYDYLNSVPC